MSGLKIKLDLYKAKKKRRIQRKAKWENWVKTQAMFYKKTSTNYQKWDYFVSSSESEGDQEAIVPDDNPEFKAMEIDIKQRSERRERQWKEAIEFKERGNMCLKKGLYKSAQKYYTDALGCRKDMMPLYTNRALARTKLEDWTGAVDDCT